MGTFEYIVTFIIVLLVGISYFQEKRLTRMNNYLDAVNEAFKSIDIANKAQMQFNDNVATAIAESCICITELEQNINDLNAHVQNMGKKP